MPMQKVSKDELIHLQQKYGIHFCKKKGTTVITICKNVDDRFIIIQLNEFISILNDRSLAVYKDKNDYLKIMKDK